MRLAKTRLTELGIERQCTKCREYWPEDTEFFYTSKRVDRKIEDIQQPCKACCLELRRKRRKGAKNDETYARVSHCFHLGLSARGFSRIHPGA